MTRFLTTEEFISRSIKIYSDQFNYSETVYTRYSAKVKLTCNYCGYTFNQIANAHLDGRGCKGCCNVKMSKDRRLPKETFIKRLEALYEDRFDCSEIDYIDTKTKITLKCPIHGFFEKEPYLLLKGKHCQKCGKERKISSSTCDQEDIIERSRLIHSNTYSYPRFVYTKQNKKAIITCPVHGDFNMQPSAHLNGQGCPKCMRCGYNQGNVGSLYIFVSDEFLKVGVTNRAVTTRLKDICKSSGKKFEIYFQSTFEDGSIPYNIEQQTLKWLRSNFKATEEIFDGSTECFLNTNVEQVRDFVLSIIN